LIGIRVRRVVGPQILDSTEVRCDHAQATGLERGDPRFGFGLGVRVLSTNERGAMTVDAGQQLAGDRCGASCAIDLEHVRIRRWARHRDAIDRIGVTAQPAERVSTDASVVRPRDPKYAVGDSHVCGSERVGKLRRVDQTFARRGMAIEIAVVAEPPQVEVRMAIGLDHADIVIVDLGGDDGGNEGFVHASNIRYRGFIVNATDIWTARTVGGLRTKRYTAP
jgi:hypothetical protein